MVGDLPQIFPYSRLGGAVGLPPCDADGMPSSASAGKASGRCKVTHQQRGPRIEELREAMNGGMCGSCIPSDSVVSRDLRIAVKKVWVAQRRFAVVGPPPPVSYKCGRARATSSVLYHLPAIAKAQHKQPLLCTHQHQAYRPRYHHRLRHHRSLLASNHGEPGRTPHNQRTW
jgi:hypothetical protein